MMKNPHPAHNRMTALSVALGLIMLLFIAALYSAQILNGSENRARSIASTSSIKVASSITAYTFFFRAVATCLTP